MTHASTSTTRLPADQVSGSSAAGPALAPVAPWIERLARVGYGAKAVLYAVVGGLALQAALGDGGRTTGSLGALATLVRQRFGGVVLIAIAAGLFGYGAWRIAEALLDPERRGVGLKGLAIRASYAARGVFHAYLGAQAVRVATGLGSTIDRSTEMWTARALDAPFGPSIVVGTGAAILGYGVYQLYRAGVAKLSRQLDLARLSRETGRWLVTVCRVGIAARAIVFILIGAYLARAGIAHSAPTAADTGEALGIIGRQPFGQWLLGAVAVGLIAYGAHEVVQARYRRIRPS